MSDSLRELSLRQFAEGVTVDGVIIEGVMGDMERLWNRVPNRHLATYLKENRIVGGYEGLGQSNELPWMHGYNSTDGKEAVAGDPPRGIENPWRAKGFAASGLDPKKSGVNDETFLLWESSVAFREPAILDSLSMTMATGTFYTNDWVYGANPPDGKGAGAPMDDFFIEVSVADRFLNAKRELEAVELHRVRFLLDSKAFSHISMAAVADTMLPYHPDGVPGRNGAGLSSPWVAVDLRRLLVPIPGNSIVRVKFGIPVYAAAVDSGWGGPVGPYATGSQVYSWSAGFLEETT